jgi:hypothetical protein
MRLAVDANEVTYDEIEALASDELVQELSEIIHLHPNNMVSLKDALKKVYSEFMTAYYEVQNALPEHEEAESLKNVYETAIALSRALNNLLSKGNSDKRLGESLRKYNDCDQWKNFQRDQYNPHFELRHFVTDIAVAAENAVDMPVDIISFVDEETDEILMSISDENHPNLVAERKDRVRQRKTPKDLPLKVGVHILKEFIETHSDVPFTAGKYYPEIGFKSPAFSFIKTIIKQLFPSVSERKIASLMQSLSE